MLATGAMRQRLRRWWPRGPQPPHTRAEAEARKERALRPERVAHKGRRGEQTGSLEKPLKPDRVLCDVTFGFYSAAELEMR